jgi:hypothetical protein
MARSHDAPISVVFDAAGAYGESMPVAQTRSEGAVYEPGDILVGPADGDEGCFQVSRVSANRSLYVMGVQRSQSAALLMAARGTSGMQRVFLLQDGSVTDYRVVKD